jgi:hypothetical protein
MAKSHRRNRLIGNPYRVPEYFRIQDIGAFALGLEPCRLWHRYHRWGELPDDDDTVALLRDAPVFLGKFLGPYHCKRFTERFDPVIAKYREFPVPTSPNEISRRLDDVNPFFSVPEVPSEPGRALIRLTAALSHRLPPSVLQWFLVGRALGRFLESLNESKDWGKRIDYANDVETAVSGTDLPFQLRPRLRRRHSMAKPDEFDDQAYEFDPRFAEWAVKQVDKSATEIYAFLSDEPVVSFLGQFNRLWLHGVEVDLTRNQSRVLAAIVERQGQAVSARDIQLFTEINGDPHKIDVYVQQIINQAVKALKVVGPPRYRNTEGDTRSWLREQLIVNVQSVGWRTGPLFRH